MSAGAITSGIANISGAGFSGGSGASLSISSSSQSGGGMSVSSMQTSTAAHGQTTSQSSLMMQSNDPLKDLIGLLALSLLAGKDDDKDHKKTAGTMLLMALAMQGQSQKNVIFQSTLQSMNTDIGNMTGQANSMSLMSPITAASSAYSTNGAASATTGTAVNMTV